MAQLKDLIVNGDARVLGTLYANGNNDITEITRNGTTFTAKRRDGTTFTFTQQDSNTTYTFNNGVSLDGTTVSNSGVRSIDTGSSNGTISVNTNGTTADVAVKGLGAAAYMGTGTSSTTVALGNHTHSVASTSAAGFMSADDKTKVTYTNIAYGTCTTDATTAAKEITISGNTKWALQAGAIIIVKFSATNTAQNPTFNVNNTGAKSIWYNTSLITTGTLGYAGTANRPMIFAYDGTQYIYLGWALEANDNTIPSGHCTTACETAAKKATFSNYALTNKSYLQVNIANSNTAASALTLNVNSKGAKPIYINGTASSASNYTLPAGSYFVYYDGTNYYFRTDGKLTANITGNAATVNGLTVQTAVPENAKFTDTTYSTGNATTAGITKLYTSTGTNTDGAMTQKAVNDLIGNINTLMAAL